MVSFFPLWRRTQRNGEELVAGTFTSNSILINVVSGLIGILLVVCLSPLSPTEQLLQQQHTMVGVASQMIVMKKRYTQQQCGAVQMLATSSSLQSRESKFLNLKSATESGRPLLSDRKGWWDHMVTTSLVKSVSYKWLLSVFVLLLFPKCKR